MKLYQQLVLFVLAATAIPVVVGFAVLRHNEEQLTQRLLSARQNSAVRLAEIIDRELREILERIEAALSYVEMGEMSKAELTGVLGIVYKQSEAIVQVALLDRVGEPVVDGVYLDQPDRFPEYSGRLAVSPAARAAFAPRVPLARAQTAPAGSAVVGKVYALDADAGLGLAVAVPVDLGHQRERWVAAVELNLAPILVRLQEGAGAQGLAVALVDEQGRLLADTSDEGDAALVSRSADPAVAKAMAGVDQGAFLDGGSMRAFARVGLVGWTIALTQSEDQALAEVRRSRRVTLTWTGVSIVAMLVLGLLFTARITRKLRLFARSAEALSAGDLDSRVEISSGDELGLLARTFNHMGEELKASRVEIEAWNEELAARVEARTRELEVAHRRLLETSKLAAIGQLGAGVAHEVNNPLVGILGNAQLLQLRHKDDEKALKALKKIEAAAKRCRDVIHNLLRFSEQEADPDHVPCDLGRILQDALSLTEERMTEQQIQVEWALAEDIPQILGAPHQLMQVFLNMFSNARTAMPDGGHLTITCRPTADDAVEVLVADDGKGISAENQERIFEPFFTTKDVWTNTGLGLSVAYRTIADHGGRIEVESQPGHGATFRVVLPTMAAAG